MPHPPILEIEGYEDIDKPLSFSDAAEKASKDADREDGEVLQDALRGVVRAMRRKRLSGVLTGEEAEKETPSVSKIVKNVVNKSDNPHGKKDKY